MVKKFSLILLSLMIITFNNFNAARANVMTIAKVNDDIITSFDFNERVKLLSVLNNLPELYSSEVKKEILNILINDKLYLIAAKSNKISIPEQEINEKANIIITEYPELKTHNNALKNYIKANMVWISLVQQKFLPKINVSPNEIAKEKRTIKNETKYSFKQALVDKNSFSKELKEQILSIKHCQQLDPILKKYNLNVSADHTLLSQEIREEVKTVFKKGSLNKPEIINVGDTFQIISICKIININPSNDEIKQKIIQDKLQKFSETYLQTLKNEAIIEIYNS